MQIYVRTRMKVDTWLNYCFKIGRLKTQIRYEWVIDITYTAIIKSD